MEKKTAVILCGGKGTRLGNLAKKLPKTLVRVHGKPILWYIIKFLEKNSFNHFILPVGYKGKMIRKYLKNNLNFKKIKLEIINTGVSSPIAYRIDKIKEKILSKNFLLINGDAIFNFKINKIFKDHLIKRNHITFLGCESKFNYGIVGIYKGKVKSFERETNFNAIFSNKKNKFMGYVYSGISIINKSLLFKIKFKKFKNFEQEFYPKIIKKFKSDFKSINGFWHSIDNQKDLEFFKKDKNKFIYRNATQLKKYLSK